LAGGWARNPLWKTARAVPSLDLRFADNKTLGDAYRGGSPVTFTRASSGTFVGSDGVIRTAATNEPRFDHNPTTGESLGLLVEEARTNLSLQSQFASSWTPTRATLQVNDIVAPDATMTGAKLVEDTTVTNTHNIGQSISFTSGTTYTVSVFAKATASPRFFQIIFPSGAFTNTRRPVFDLVSGTALASTDTTASIQNFGNGWYRCVASMAATATTSSTIQLQLADTYTNGAPSYTGNGVSGVYIWGAQLEAGAFATSYIPTTTATVTRAADVASITGSNFSSFYNQTEGTVFADAKVTTVAPATSLTSVFALSDGTTSNRIAVYKRANADTSTRLDVQTSGSSVVFINAGTFGVSNLIAASYRVDDFAISLNGLTPGTDTLGAIPTVSRLNIGNYADSTLPLNGTIKRLTYWPTRLADTTLQQITQP
jgi:hypothetical protein